MSDIEPTSIQEQLDDLQRKFKWHNHADGITQPVFIGPITQGTATQLQPSSYGGILGEDVTNGNALYMNSDGKIYKAASTSQDICDRFIGIATQSQTTGANALFIAAGVKTDYTNLTAGAFYYLTNTAGTIGTTPGSYTKKVGIALSATTLLIFI